MNLVNLRFTLMWRILLAFLGSAQRALSLRRGHRAQISPDAVAAQRRRRCCCLCSTAFTAPTLCACCSRPPCSACIALSNSDAPVIWFCELNPNSPQRPILVRISAWISALPPCRFASKGICRAPRASGTVLVFVCQAEKLVIVRLNLYRVPKWILTSRLRTRHMYRP